MSKTEERNKRANQILQSLYERAKNPKLPCDEKDYESSLDALFTTTVWGYREILLVVIVAMKLDPTYKASSGLYDCSPRALFEGPIKEFLIEKNIPHRKSGPLNIAKATQGLNRQWAAQRRPADVAEKVVWLVDYLERSRDRTDAVGISLLRRLLSYARAVEALAVTIEPSEDPNFLYDLSHELIVKEPDAGNTPQKIAALLLKNYHRWMHTRIIVTGGEDRASTTSTTSKKPGDVNEEIDGVVLKVYEVTVKPFGLARIRDSYDCVVTYNDEQGDAIKEIVVLCREEDCPPDMIRSGLRGYLGYYTYQDMTYYYWEIFEWIANTLQRMTPEGRKFYYMELNSYINDTNTAESVKKLWNELHTAQ